MLFWLTGGAGFIDLKYMPSTCTRMQSWTDTKKPWNSWMCHYAGFGLNMCKWRGQAVQVFAPGHATTWSRRRFTWSIRCVCFSWGKDGYTQDDNLDCTWLFHVCAVHVCVRTLFFSKNVRIWERASSSSFHDCLIHCTSWHDCCFHSLKSIVPFPERRNKHSISLLATTTLNTQNLGCHFQ